MHCIDCSKGQIFALFCVAVPRLASLCVILEANIALYLHCIHTHCTAVQCIVQMNLLHFCIALNHFTLLQCIVSGGFGISVLHCIALYVEPLAYYLSHRLQQHVMSLCYNALCRSNLCIKLEGTASVHCMQNLWHICPTGCNRVSCQAKIQICAPVKSY